MSSHMKFDQTSNSDMVFLKDFFEKVDFEKISRQQKSVQNYTVGKELTLTLLGNFSCFFVIC